MTARPDHDQIERDRLRSMLSAAIKAADRNKIDAAMMLMQDLARKQEAVRIAKEWPPIKQDYLQGDYERVGSYQASDWGE